MTPQNRAALLPGAVWSEAFGQWTAAVPRVAWVASVVALRDHGYTYFDLLTAVDEVDDGFAVVVHLYSPGGASGVQVRTSCPHDDPAVPSLVEVFAGADWHERAAAEMFGVTFTGHPGLLPLLLPDGFDGHPLRKDFLLASRVDKVWPGAT